MDEKVWVIKDGNTDSKVFIPRTEIDTETRKQIRSMILHPSISHSRIMPDCHRGVGCCVGFTFNLGDKIVPNYIGGDIGCGILTYNIGFLRDNNKNKLHKIDSKIREVVPMGNGKFCIWQEPCVKDEDLEKLVKDANEDALKFIKQYKEKFEIDLTEYKPEYSIDWMKELCIKINSNYEYDLKCLGTLGGGNHYIEMNVDKVDNRYITIHSGSRSFGGKICRHHQDKITKERKIDWEEVDLQSKKIRRIHKASDFIKKEKDKMWKDIHERRHEPYLEGEEAYLYFFDMIFAQKYAQLNRRLMLRNILDRLGFDYNEETVIESIHNYIDFNDFIVRKGAIPAHEGQKCIISLNMRDGILMCKGKGDWNYSSAHGAGRLLMRSQAFQKLSMKKFKEEMKDVFSTSVVPSTLDESPMAYKDTEFIKEAIGDTVEILEQLKPILNIKAT
jgi:tRNA-splicing ligase RtcB